MLVAGKDYHYGDPISGFGKTVYESVADNDTYFVTQDTSFVRSKTYHVLEPVTDLVVGDDVSGYYVVVDGYSHAEHDDYVSTEETYYKPIELTPGVDYVINTLIPNNTYYEAYDDGKRYYYTDDMFFTAGTTYYLFKAVRGYSPSVESLDDLFTYNDGRFMICTELVPGSDYIVKTNVVGGNITYEYSPSFDYIIGTNIEADNTVYYRSGNRYLPAAKNTKYKRDVVYYSFSVANGFILNSAIDEYFIDASDVYDARVMRPVEDYTVGGAISGNVVVADTFVQTDDETYKAGKLYFRYDTGFILHSNANRYFIDANGYYKARSIQGTGAITYELYEYDSALGRYVGTTDDNYVVGKTYYMFDPVEGYLPENDLDGYYLSGIGYYSRVPITFTAGNLISSYPVPVYIEQNGRTVQVAGNEQFVSGTTYYKLIESGFVKISDLHSYYVDGSGYYTRTQLTANDDYAYGDRISANVYVFKNGRYIRPSEVLYEAQKIYYRMDNAGLILNSGLSAYYINGTGYYTFTELTADQFTVGAAIDDNIYTGEIGKFTIAKGFYSAGKTYYLRSDEGIISVNDLSTFYFDAAGYYSLSHMTEGNDYTVGEDVPTGTYYEFDAQGVLRMTSDLKFISGKGYYGLFSDKTYLRADTIGKYYSVRADKFSPICLTEGVDYAIGDDVEGDVFVVSDNWYGISSSGATYQADKTYIVWESKAGYIAYGDVATTYKKVTTSSGRYSAVLADDYIIGGVISNGYYVKLSAEDGRLIQANDSFLYGTDYYKLETNGFIYCEAEDQLYASETKYQEDIHQHPKTQGLQVPSWTDRPACRHGRTVYDLPHGG